MQQSWRGENLKRKGGVKTGTIKKTIVLAKHQTGGKEREKKWRNRKKRSTPQWWKAKLRRQRQQGR